MFMGIRSGAWTKYQVRPVVGTGSMLIPGPMIQDRDGFIWIGAQGSGVIKFDGYDIKRHIAGPVSIPDDNVVSLYEDRDGIIWIGTLGGLGSYDKSPDAFRSYLHAGDRAGSIGSNRISTSSQAILEDEEGKIWVATANGLNSFDKSADAFVRYLHDPGKNDSLDSNSILAVCEGREGFLWVYTDKG